MSVNTMEFKDAAAILNNIRKQVTGETAIAPANTAEFVSVATTLLQAGYDHNFCLSGNPCAILSDPVSGRRMEVRTDCPGLQVYSGNFLRGEAGKDGVSYCYRGGVALEPQFFPDAVHKPRWPQPIVKAGMPYRSQTLYIFK